jgi:pimeloyl-ACP methyl ester carboxylesterase
VRRARVLVNHHRIGTSESLYFNNPLLCTNLSVLFSISTFDYITAGNPGIVSFYRGFLDFIHRAHPSLGILAHSHLGHSPRLGRLPPTGAGAISRDAAGLEVQVQATIEVYDALMNEYRDVGGCKVILVGHSIGAWIATQARKTSDSGRVVSLLILWLRIVQKGDDRETRHN